MKKLLLLIPLALLFSCSMKNESGTISVTGTGEVYAVPDTAQIGITVSEKSDTTGEAQRLSNEKIRLILEELKKSGVAEKDISTSAIRFSNDYVWNPETRKNEIAGRIVSQTVTVRFTQIDQSPSALASILDVLGRIDGIEIGNLQFSIEDPQSLYGEARRLAYEKAEQKARELAGYADLKLGKALSISEPDSGSLPYAGNIMLQRNAVQLSEDSGAPSAIPGGEISIRYDITVVYQSY